MPPGLAYRQSDGGVFSAASQISLSQVDTPKNKTKQNKLTRMPVLQYLLVSMYGMRAGFHSVPIHSIAPCTLLLAGLDGDGDIVLASWAESRPSPWGQSPA